MVNLTKDAQLGGVRAGIWPRSPPADTPPVTCLSSSLLASLRGTEVRNEDAISAQKSSQQIPLES